MKQKEYILIIGALGQIGRELTDELRERYGKENVLAADIRPKEDVSFEKQPYMQLNVMDKGALESLIAENKFTQIYHLAAMLSASGERNPQAAWELNMNSLLSILDLSVKYKVGKVFWPSSIAVFGPDSAKQNCPQQGVTEPSTIYGISKAAGEYWCKYYFEKHGLDVRSVRYPGLISYTGAPGGGTTDYAVDIFHSAVKGEKYACFLKEDTALPMMYMHDAIRATLELMDAPSESLSVRTAYNLSALSFTPKEIYDEIAREVPGFEISYAPDFRQQIADSWPQSIDDSVASKDWGWKPAYDLQKMVKDMLSNIEVYP
ncbi:NAD-dependent epimerase/dehydratase family protein [Pedobacter sp. V48]|uniref:NAD-dependent epimerase/dehydratase family protein n=1 Tax=Pedobacter sp. V48 TaxID=509635 RepID=UPI0004B72A50|nr:NAD-dependent epimerase/dehydratase family protein [Pedobacter sp. V48]